jgi:hypothetical protein
MKVDETLYPQESKLAQFSQLFRSVGFGSLFAVQAATVICWLYPKLIPDNVEFEFILAASALSGAIAHRIIDGILIHTFLYPLGRYINFWRKVLEVKLMTRVLGEERAEAILVELTTRHILGSDYDKLKLLPPPKVEDLKQLENKTEDPDASPAEGK